MNKRVREIRKSLKMKQSEFGAKIGLGQQAITMIEKGVNTLTDRNFDNICRVFNVNPEWLRTGEGEMFNTAEKSPLDIFTEKYDLDEDEKSTLELYLGFPPEQRKVIADWLFESLILMKVLAENPKDIQKRCQELEQTIVDAKQTMVDAKQTMVNAQKELAEIKGNISPKVKDLSDAAG